MKHTRSTKLSQIRKTRPTLDPNAPIPYALIDPDAPIPYALAGSAPTPLPYAVAAE
jgi:hypothetical protein